ncbi:hypothetical protein UPYG_G00031020 [Umbra pygmaea]|uniref:E3 ubiquitin-protein ligase RNF138 n=1 Tax=Umbra pygmaea TaxID=75934 RepID=A0ABD0Y6L1_UMBPY
MAHSEEGQQTLTENACPICLNTLTDPHQPAGCSHVCCRSCLTNSLVYLSHCPVCRAKARLDDIVPAGGGAAGVQTRSRVSRLGRPLPGLSGFSMPAARSVAGDIQSRIRMLQMASQNLTVNTAPPIPAPRLLPRRSLFVTPSVPENYSYMSVGHTAVPTSTTNLTTTNTAVPSALADGAYMTMAQISAPSIAPAAALTAPAHPLNPIPQPRIVSGPPASGPQPLVIGQHTPSPSQPISHLQSTIAPPVLDDSLDDTDLDQYCVMDDPSLSFSHYDAEVRTFVCPFCQESNLDDLDLLEHCNVNHFNDRRLVVCPICVSLPHGNPDQMSRDFIGHLNLRHCYYAQDYMNIHQSDTINMQGAIFDSFRDVKINQ